MADVGDGPLVRLLTTVFFAGLETYEGEHNAVGVVFFGRTLVDVVLREGADQGLAPLYRWKIHPFESTRPLSVPKLVKLAVAGTDRRIDSAVHQMSDGRLAITGLAREGFNVDADPFVKVVAARPGALSPLAPFGAPSRRRRSRRASRTKESSTISTRFVLSCKQMAAHGRGGILVIAREDHPRVVESGAYKMPRNSSLVAVLRLARRIGRKSSDRRSSPPPSEPGSARSSRTPPTGPRRQASAICSAMPF